MNATSPAKIIRVEVPGKVMLAGEYAVLQGGSALSVTIDATLEVNYSGLGDLGFLTVASNLWSEPRRLSTAQRSQDLVHEPLLQAVARGMELTGLTQGCLSVTSELDVSFGVGSSSALRLGVLSAMMAAATPTLQDEKTSAINWEAAAEALKLQRQSQTHASGYDLGTQVIGGLVSFAAPSEVISPRQLARATTGRHDLSLSKLQDLVHVYVGGRGAPTGAVMGSTRQWLESNRLDSRLNDLSEDLVDAFVKSLLPSNADTADGLLQLANAVARHRRVFAGGPCFPHSVAAVLDPLPGRDEQWSYKTTGAGGEDALLLIGLRENLQPADQSLAELGWRPINHRFDHHGTRITSVQPAAALRFP